MSYRYLLGGLEVESSIELPALHPYSGPASSIKTVTLKEEKVSSNLQGIPTSFGRFIRFNEREFYFEYPDLIAFKIIDGSEVHLQFLSRDREAGLNYFYSNGLAALMLQNRCLPFHVSSVLSPSGLVWMIAGNSGYGKSSTLVKLLEKGYRYYSDDVLVFHLTESGFQIFPTLPLVRLWQDTLENQRLFRPEKKDISIGEKGKSGYFYHQKYHAEPHPAGGIFFLNPHHNRLDLCAMSPMESLLMFERNLYRKQWIPLMNLNREKFQLLAALSRKVPAWEAFRPKDQNSFESFSALLDQQIQESEAIQLRQSVNLVSTNVS